MLVEAGAVLPSAVDLPIARLLAIADAASLTAGAEAAASN